MHNYRLVVFFLLIMIGVGIASLLNMPKQEFPEFKIIRGMVVALYPGASAEEVEKQVTNRLEDYLFTFPEVDAEKTRSTSSDGMSVVHVFLNDEGAKDPKAAWGRIRDGFPLLQKTILPMGVLGTALFDNFGDAAADLIVLESKTKSYREMNEYASKLKTELQGVNNITNLKIQGVLHEQIGIYLDKERMVRFGVSSTMINTVLAMQGITTGGAHVGTETTDMPIYVSTSYTTERQLADQIILNDPTGKMVRLKDVARVVRKYPEVKSYISNNGTRAVLVGMEMKKGGDIVAFGNDVNSKVEEFKKTLPDDISLTYIADQPKVVSDSIISFFGDFLEAIAIVVLVMMILFPIRSALVAGLAIPITIITTFTLMNAFSIPLSNVTLAALIVSLGMVVDDSIIIIDAHQELMRKGHSSWFASVMSAHTFFPSIALATFSICLVFLPAPMFMSSFFATLVEVFVYTLIISLLVSLVVAMLIVPLLNKWILGRSSRDFKIKESKLLVPVQKGYEYILEHCFKHPWATIAICIAVIAGGAWLFTTVPQKMIPNADRNQFVVEIYNPNGTSIDHTAGITDSVAHELLKDERVENVTEFVGQLMPRFMVSAPIAMGGKSFSQIIVKTKGNQETLDVIRDYTGRFESRWPETYVRMMQLSYSMDSGLELMLEGNDLDHLHLVSDSIQQYLRTQESLLWVHDAFGEKTPVTRIDLDPISAAQLGVTRMSVASNMALKYGGLKAGSVWEEGYEMPVILYTADENTQHDLSNLGDEYIGTTFGGNVPLRQVASIRPAWQEASISHLQGKRCLRISADVKPGYSTAKIIKTATKHVEENIMPHMPTDVKLKRWGTAKMNEMIAQPLGKSFLLSLCVIIFVMVLNFKRFRLSLLAMSGTLLALPGAALGQWMSGCDFSLTSILGIFSLLGIVMRNTIIMFDYAEELRQKGISVREAAMEAGKRRMIPIFLTSATTAAGVIPLMVFPSTLWPPMGWVICFGTITATLLVVTVMPCAYWKLMDKKTTK